MVGYGCGSISVPDMLSLLLQEVNSLGGNVKTSWTWSLSGLRLTARRGGIEQWPNVQGVTMNSEIPTDKGEDESLCSPEPSPDFDWSSLPEELVHHVLQRLPLESVMQFRCVCRKWNELLMSPTFSHSFHHKPGKLVPLYLDGRTITLYSTRNQMWLPHNLDSTLAQAPLAEDEASLLDLVASGGGLLGFMVRGATELEYLIWNPLMEQSQWLQPMQKWENGEPLHLILSPANVMSKYLLYGISVDFKAGYYSFVIVDPGSLNHESTTLIYDSRLRSWKAGSKVPMAIIQLDSYSPLSVNSSIGGKSQCVTSEGKLNWLVEHDDGSSAVYIYDIKLDRWSYLKCSTPHDRLVFIRLLEHKSKVLLVGKRSARMSMNPFCYFEIVEMSGSLLQSCPRSFDEYRELHLLETVTPFEMAYVTLDSAPPDGSKRSDARPCWCVGAGKEVFFLHQERLVRFKSQESRTIDGYPSDGRMAVRFTSPMMRYSAAENSWTWLTNWKTIADGSGILKPCSASKVWAFQPSLVLP